MAHTDYDAHRKAELIAELDAARREIRLLGAGVRRQADVTAQFKKSFKVHKAVWIGGAAVGGLLLAMLLRPQRKVHVVHAAESHPSAGQKLAGAGILFATARFAFSVLEPVLKNLLRKYVTSRFVERDRDSGGFGF